MRIAAMKFYLSSYKLGRKTEQLKNLLPQNKKTAYIDNARDFSTDFAKRRQGAESDMKELSNLGLNVELLNLHRFFGEQDRLRIKTSEYGVIWVVGGNLFVLRQAFRLSGFDDIIRGLAGHKDILYGGYSAGICILAPTLKGLDLMDDPSARPYGENYETIWEGLGLIDYSIVPHYKSDHPESEAASRVVEFMIENKMPFKALRDGEAIIIQ